MITLRNGSRALEVFLLQRMLNVHFETDRTVPGIDEDSIFGRQTEALLRRFQDSYRGPMGRLTVDGVAGANTWRALGLSADVAWPVPQVGQNSSMSCWVVSAGMATGSMSSVVPPTARVESLEASYPDGRDGGGLPTDTANLTAYASGLGMRFLNAAPNNINGILEHLRRGPAILIGKWASGGAHAVVITAVYVGPSNQTSMVRINNPSPMGRGSIELSVYPGMTLEGEGFIPRRLIVK